MEDYFALFNNVIVNWEKSLTNQHEAFKTTISPEVQYSFTEFKSVSSLLKLRNESNQQYFTAYLDLENRKEKLFNTGEVAKWDVDFTSHKLSPDDLLKNRKLAKALMLPQVNVLNLQSTNVIKQMQKFCGFMNNQLREQSEYVGCKRAKRSLLSLIDWTHHYMILESDVVSSLSSDFCIV